MRCVDWNLTVHTSSRANQRHTSYEVCGLKFSYEAAAPENLLVTPRMRCVDWNCTIMAGWLTPDQSHLVWGVWIEITPAINATTDLLNVTPRMRCVDWNTGYHVSREARFPVTPRMRCVDWNIEDQPLNIRERKSHLVWGVWIEI